MAFWHDAGNGADEHVPVSYQIFFLFFWYSRIPFLLTLRRSRGSGPTAFVPHGGASIVRRADRWSSPGSKERGVTRAAGVWTTYIQDRDTIYIKAFSQITQQCIAYRLDYTSPCWTRPIMRLYATLWTSDAVLYNVSIKIPLVYLFPEIKASLGGRIYKQKSIYTGKTWYL